MHFLTHTKLVRIHGECLLHFRLTITHYRCTAKWIKHSRWLIVFFFCQLSALLWATFGHLMPADRQSLGSKLAEINERTEEEMLNIRFRLQESIKYRESVFNRKTNSQKQPELTLSFTEKVIQCFTLSLSLSSGMILYLSWSWSLLPCSYLSPKQRDNFLLIKCFSLTKLAVSQSEILEAALFTRDFFLLHSQRAWKRCFQWATFSDRFK